MLEANGSRQLSFAESNLPLTRTHYKYFIRSSDEAFRRAPDEAFRPGLLT